MTSPTKLCLKCFRTKPVTEFSPNRVKGARDGLQSYCKTCRALHAKAKYAEYWAGQSPRTKLTPIESPPLAKAHGFINLVYSSERDE